MNKTPMQILIEELEVISLDKNLSIACKTGIATSIALAKMTLPLERQAIIDAANVCSTILIANDIQTTGNHFVSLGENYYNQTYTTQNNQHDSKIG